MRSLSTHPLVVAAALLLGACTSGAPRYVDGPEMTRLVDAPVGTLHACTPLAITGDRAYAELWRGGDRDDVEVVWTRAVDLSQDVRRRFAER